MNDASAKLKIFQGRVDSGSRSVRQLGNSFDTLNNRMSTPLSKLRDYVLILGNIRLAILNVRDIAVGWIGATIQQSAQVERLTILMKGLSAASTDVAKSQEAAANMQMLFREARRTGFAIDALADSFVKMKSGGIDPTKGALQSLTNAVANFGGNSDVMHRASIAIQQMAGKGVISMEELRQQLGEAVPTAMADMARAMGMSIKDFTKLVSKGVVQAKPALELMFREFDRLYGGAGERMASTLTGQLAIFKTNLMELSTVFTGLKETGEGAKGGIFDQAKTALEQMNAAMQSNEGRQFVADFGAAIAALMRGLMAVGGFIVRFRTEIGVALAALVTGFAAIKAANLFNWLWMSIGTGITQLRNLGLQSTATAGTFVGSMQSKTSAMQAYANQLRQKMALQNGHAVLMQRELIATHRASQAAMNQVATLRLEQTALTAKIATERAAIRAAQQAQIQAQANIATGVRMATSIRQLNAAKSAEAMASLRLGQAERSLAANKIATTRAIQIETAAIHAETAAVSRSSTVKGAATVGQRVWTGAMIAGAGAARMLGAAVSIALGPIGMIALALYAAAEAAGVFENRADRAAAAAERLRRGMGTLADAEAAQQGIAANNSRLAKIDDMLNNGVKNGYGKRVALLPQQRANLEAERKKLRGQNAQTARDVAYGKDGIAEQEGRYVADRVQNRANNALRPYTNRYQEAVRTGQPQSVIDKAAEDLAAARKRTVQAGLDSLAAQRKAAKDRGDDHEVKRLDAAADAWRETNALTLQATESTKELRDAAVGAGEAGAAGGKKAGKGMSDAEKAAKKAATEAQNLKEKFDNMLGNQAGEIAELNAELFEVNDSGEKAGTALAGFQARVKAGLFNGATAEQLKKLEENFREIDRLTSERDWGRGLRQLRKEVAQTTAEANGLWRALQADNTGRAFDDYTRAEGVRSRFADKLEAAAGDPVRLAQVNAEIDKIIANLNRIDAANAANDWRTMAEEIEISLMDENEARQRNFDLEVERQMRLLDLVRNNAEASVTERQLAEDRFARWHALAQQKMQRESERSTTTMARDWAKLGQNIDRALGGALNSFVDGMFDAEFNFGDFAIGIIKELAKIIIKAMIAYAILSAIGMANNSAGQKVSFGQFMKGQISGGFGGTTDNASRIGFGSQGDTSRSGFGAIVPSTSGALVDPGKGTGMPTSGQILRGGWHYDPTKYHTGGWLGRSPLKPGEVPFIGLEDEVVLTKDQQNAVAGMIGGGGAEKPNVTVNVINNSGQQLEAEQGEPEFNGRDMIVNVVVEAAQKQGPLRDVLSSMSKS